ncbi:MAG: ABC transporter ATP-binding protein [Desulfarculaceae bacterium]
MFFEARGVSKSFGALMAVASVSLQIAQGEVVSIIGPNGAGKTTLFNLITGVHTPDQGTITFEDRDITRAGPDQLCRRGLARSFQITNIFQGLSVFENLRLASQGRLGKMGLMGLVNRWRGPLEEAERLLNLLNLGEYKNELAGNLSHGDQRYLEMGIALASRPSLLLLDEPTAGMTPSETRATSDLLKKVREQTTIVLIEHDLDVVFQVSDRIIVLHQGQVLAQGLPQEVKANPEVQAAYFGEETDA